MTRRSVSSPILGMGDGILVGAHGVAAARLWPAQCPFKDYGKPIGHLRQAAKRSPGSGCSRVDQQPVPQLTIWWGSA